MVREEKLPGEEINLAVAGPDTTSARGVDTPPERSLGSEPLLTLRLLGSFEALRDGIPLPRLHSRKSLWLLALLVLRRSPVERSWLAGTLWPESSQSTALKNLRNCLNELRRALGPAGRCLYSPTPRSLALDLADAAVDLLAFDQCLARGDAASLREAVALYRGPLLQECDEAWVLPERQVREEAFLGALESLAAAALQAGDPCGAERCLRRTVAVDPLRESAQRALMQALGLGGNYAAALEVYRDLRLRLHRELNAEPDPETKTLYDQLRAEARSPTRRPNDRSPRRAPDAGSSSPASIPMLPGELPPLSARAHPSNNLPAQPTPLLGREREVAVLWEWLRGDGVRLLTLTGPGGTGKTRLGLQVAVELLDSFEDGAFFVDLAPLRDPSLVASAVAQVLGVREGGEPGLLESLKQHLREKQILLLLDNFEHLLAAAPLAAELLAAAPRLKVLVTSRAALHLRGEQEFPVEPLPVPDPRRLPPVEALSQYGAVALFIQRAVNARPDFVLTNENAPAVVEICQRLDGLPLAIELAAARLKLFTPAALLARLDSRLKVLTGGARDLPARQQTLQDAIAWSYDLLQESEQRLFRRLSVFVGGCTLEAAEAVCAAEGDLEIDVLDGIASLVDKSLLRQLEPDGPDLRFTMLETIREYGLECLTRAPSSGRAPGEEEAIRQRHARFFLKLAEGAEPCLVGAEQEEWLVRLELELPNLRAALAWSLESGEIERGARATAALQEFWVLQAQHRVEGLRWFEEFVTRSAHLPIALQAEARLGAGYLHSVVDDEEGGRQLCEESLALFREANDLSGIAHSLHSLSHILLWRGDHAAARAFAEESLAIRRALGSKRDLPWTLDILAHVAMVEGDESLGRSLYEEALTIARTVGNKAAIAWTLSKLADAAIRQGSLVSARSSCEPRQETPQELIHGTGTAVSTRPLEEAAWQQEKYREAKALSDEALVIFQQLDQKAGIVTVLHTLGTVDRCQGDYAAARKRFEEALTRAREIGSRYYVASAQWNLALIARHQDDRKGAHALLQETFTGGRELHNERILAHSLLEAGHLRYQAGDAARAVRLFAAALARRHLLDVLWLPCDRDECDHHVAATRAILGEEIFAAAWAEGQAMTLDQAVTYALQSGCMPEND